MDKHLWPSYIKALHMDRLNVYVANHRCDASEHPASTGGEWTSNSQEFFSAVILLLLKSALQRSCTCKSRWVGGSGGGGGGARATEVIHWYNKRSRKVWFAFSRISSNFSNNNFQKTNNVSKKMINLSCVQRNLIDPELATKTTMNVHKMRWICIQNRIQIGDRD